MGNNKYNKGIYAFSGDPITNGHENIVERASKMFDKLIVAIGVNPDKNYTFTLEERKDMARKALEHLPNVGVVSFEGLLVDFAYENKIPTIVRGIRNSKDLVDELTLFQAGKAQKYDIDTIFLPAEQHLAHISSSVVKALIKEQGSVEDMVHLYVKQRLEEKMLNQYVIGITGGLGVGKSYIGKKFQEIGRKKGVKVYNIDLDSIGHQILSGELTQPRYKEIRGEIIETFGKKVGLPKNKINRKALGEIVFNDTAQMKKLNEIMHKPILTRLRKDMHGKKGVILVNAALIAETDLSYICNNNVVLISADERVQRDRLMNKNLTVEQIERRVNSQYTTAGKKAHLEGKIEKNAHCGKLWEINNSGNLTEKDIEQFFERVVNEVGVKI